VSRPIALVLPLALVLAAACSHAPSGPTARACTLAAPTPSDWRLHTDGALLKDGLGRVVLLRGVDAGGRSKMAPFAPFDFTANGYDAALASYLDRAKSWGIDVLRVPFTWAAVEPTQGADDEAFLKRYDALIDAAWSRGIWSVVDLHQDVYAENFCGDGFPSWTIPDPKPAPHHDNCGAWGLEYFGDKEVAAAFDRLWASGSTVQAGVVAVWDRMVARYKDRAGVLGFEVLNEPGWGTQDVTKFEAGSLTQFFAVMTPRMRAAAPTSLVFLDPTGFAGTTMSTGLTLPKGDGIVFAPHFYPLNNNPPAVGDKLQPWSVLGKQWNVPVFLGEFGAQSTSAQGPDYITAVFDALDAYGMHGTQWEYSVSADSWNDETYGMVAADGTEFAATASAIRPYARAVAGAGVAESIDAASHAFTLTYTPAAGVTEITLPSRAYANGYDVALTGACVDRTQPERLLVQADPGATSVTLTVTSR
jgi:endoglycosylceramidase